VNIAEELRHFLGISCCIVGEGGIEYLGYHGMCSLEAKKPVNERTRFLTASISKLFVATAVMQLHESGKLDIDTDISKYVSLNVSNPHGGEITARMLLEHSSGLSDNELGLITWRYNKFSPVSLEEQVARHIIRGGKFYSDSLWSPSGNYSYSNAGFTLLGYLVEEVSGEPFCQYMEAHIQKPLQMETATWDIPLDDNSAVPHVGNRELGHYCVAEYPACQLRASVEDLAKFLQFFITGEYNGSQILKPESVALMCPSNYYHGLGWWGKDACYGYPHEDVWIHGGFMDGVRTQINFYPRYKKGLVILSNNHTPYSKLEELLVQKIKFGDN